MKTRAQDTDFYKFAKQIFPKLHRSRLLALELIVKALISTTSVNFVKLATDLNTKACNSSNYRRIQRFFAEVVLGQENIARWIVRLMGSPERITLAMDRTNWKLGKSNINYLVLSVCHKGISIPLFWSVLGKKGNSHTSERIQLVQRFIDVFGAAQIDFLLADREFIGKTWQQWLIDNQIPFYIRIKCDAQVNIKGKVFKASSLFKNLDIGHIKFKNGFVNIYGTDVCVSAKRILNRQNKPELLIIISYFEPRKCFLKYAQRWEIETMFKALKSSGFDIETTHVTIHERLDRLMAVAAMAFAWAYFTGVWLLANTKLSIKKKKHGRNEKTIFKLGLEELRRLIITTFSKYFNNPYQVLSCT